MKWAWPGNQPRDQPNGSVIIGGKLQWSYVFLALIHRFVFIYTYRIYIYIHNIYTLTQLSRKTQVDANEKCTHYMHYDYSVSPGSKSHRTHCRVVSFALIRWFIGILYLSYFKINIFMTNMHK